jgi:tetratricopeptide (TPR) repeat protein
VRLTPLLAAAAFLAAVPCTARAQTDPSLKLSTTNSVAASEFRAGVSDFENIAFESAREHLAAAVKADPNFGLARVFWAGITPFTTASAREAELNRGVADAARGSVNELALAAAYREAALNHRPAAAAFLRAAAQLMPSDRLIAVNAALGDVTTPAEATTRLREFTSRYPDYAPAYNTLAYNLWGTGDHAGALAAAKRQVELNPSAPNPHDTYAEILQFNGNFPEATAHYMQATKLSPRFPGAYSGLAEVAVLQGNYDQARSYLNQAVAASYTPLDKLGYMTQIAGTYALQGSSADVLTKQLDAIATEAKALNRPDDAAEAYSQIAAAEATAGNTAAAHKYIAMAKATGTADAWWPHYYSAMGHGILKHWAPANEEVSALKALSAKDPGVSKDHIAAVEGYLLTQQGKPADALTVLMAADTTNFIVMNRIAEAHAALGHVSEATAWNNRISSNYAINLQDFPGINSRRRASVKSAMARR